MTDKLEKLMVELGYISLYFSNFDMQINELNSSLINPTNNKIGLSISSKLSTHGRLDLAKELLNIIPIDENIKLTAKTNIESFNTIKQKRNQLIHGFWHTNEEDGIMLPELYISKFSDIYQDKKITIKDLSSLKENLKTLIQKQRQLNEEIISAYNLVLNKEKERQKAIQELFNNTNNDTN